VREQGVEMFVEGGGQAPQDVFEVGARVMALRLGAFNQGVADAGGVAAGLAAGEQPVFAADRDDAQGAFGGVVVDHALTVVEIAVECLSVILHIADRRHGGRVGQQLLLLVVEEAAQVIEPGASVLGAPALALVVIQIRFAGLALEIKQRVDALQRAAGGGGLAVFGHLKELAPRMRPAADFVNVRGPDEQFIVGAGRVRLQVHRALRRTKAGQPLTHVLALLIEGEVVVDELDLRADIGPGARLDGLARGLQGQHRPLA